jgi:hypothetical protein
MYIFFLFFKKAIYCSYDLRCVIESGRSFKLEKEESERVKIQSKKKTIK